MGRNLSEWHLVKWLKKLFSPWGYFTPFCSDSQHCMRLDWTRGGAPSLKLLVFSQFIYFELSSLFNANQRRKNPGACYQCPANLVPRCHSRLSGHCIQLWSLLRFLWADVPVHRVNHENDILAGWQCRVIRSDKLEAQVAEGP